MLEALAAIVAAGIGASVALLAVAIGNEPMARIDKLAAVIEKLEPGSRRDDLITIRTHLLDRYITGWTAPARRRAVAALLFVGSGLMALGVSTIFWLPQLLIDLLNVRSEVDFPPVYAASQIVLVALTVAGLLIGGWGFVRLLRGR